MFAAAAKLPKRQIQTYEDVFKAYCCGLMTDDTEPKLMFKMVKILPIEVKDICTKASIPSIDLQSIAISIQRLISKARKLEKYSKLKRTSATFHDNCSSFQKLFDVCTCKCYDAGVKERTYCNASWKRKSLN